MGFDLEATTEDYGRKRWRLRSAFHRLRSKRRKYQTLRAVLDILLNQAEQLEDRHYRDIRGIVSYVEHHLLRKNGLVSTTARHLRGPT